MDWVFELVRIWVALDKAVTRSMFGLKLQEYAHPELVEKLAERGDEFDKEQLILNFQRWDLWRIKKGNGKGKAEGDGGGNGGVVPRLPGEEWKRCDNGALGPIGTCIA